MTHAQLEALADQLIAGEITVDQAKVICDADGRSKHQVAIWYPAPEVDEDERPQDDSERIEAQERKATWHYRDPLQTAQVRWPVVSYEPWDKERGYIADPTNIKSDAALEMEYAKPYYREVVDFERTDDGYLVLDESGARVERREQVLTMGSVEWEYRRRSQGRDVWMSRHAYKHVQEQERARRRRIEQRRAVARLVRECGGDPRDAEVIAWVQRVGIETALAKLTARARREGVIA